MKKGKLLVIIWQRYGPYHYARLRGAREVLQALGWEVMGLQVAGLDHYQWDEISNGEELKTVFPSRKYEEVPKKEIREEVSKALVELEPTAVAINGWSVPEAMGALGWCKKNKRRAILMSETFRSSGSKLKELVKKRRVSKFDAALVGGKWHAGYLVSLGFKAEKIQIGYDAVDNEYFEKGAGFARENKVVLRDRYRLPEKYFFVNTRFIRRKNVDGLLRAFAKYREQDGGWSLVISGSGELEEEWRALAKELQVDEAVHWLGFLQYEDLPIYYGLASAFVHPAHEEPWGLVVNEAAAVGLPIICGKEVGASCELVHEGENGFLFDSHNYDELAVCLLNVSSLSREEREKMEARSSDIVSAYGVEAFGQGLVKGLG